MNTVIDIEQYSDYEKVKPGVLGRMYHRHQPPQPPKWGKTPKIEDRGLGDNTQEILQGFKNRRKANHGLPTPEAPRILEVALGDTRALPPWWNRYGNVATRDDGHILIWDGEAWKHKIFPLDKTASFEALYGGPRRSAQIRVPTFPQGLQIENMGRFMDRVGNRFLRGLRELRDDMDRHIGTIQHVVGLQNPCGEIHPDGYILAGLRFRNLGGSSFPPPPKPDLVKLCHAAQHLDKVWRKGAWKVPFLWKTIQIKEYEYPTYIRRDGVSVTRHANRWALTIPKMNCYHIPEDWKGIYTAPMCLWWVDKHLVYPWVPITRMEMLLDTHA